MPKNLTNLHATALKFNFGTKSFGVLLMGTSGSGKSLLSLQIMREKSMDWDSVELISDDQIFVENVDGKLIASTPATIAGKIELRGYGIIDNMPYAPRNKIDLVVEICAADAIERMPEAGFSKILDVKIKTVQLPQEDFYHAMLILNQVCKSLD